MRLGLCVCVHVCFLSDSRVKKRVSSVSTKRVVMLSANSEWREEAVAEDDEGEEIGDDSLEAMFAEDDVVVAPSPEVKRKRVKKDIRANALTPLERQQAKAATRVTEKRQKKRRKTALDKSRSAAHTTRNRKKAGSAGDRIAKSLARASTLMAAAEKAHAQLVKEVAKGGKSKLSARVTATTALVKRTNTLLKEVNALVTQHQMQASQYLQKYATVVQPLLEINVSRIQGQPLQVTHHSRWSFMSGHGKPKV